MCTNTTTSHIGLTICYWLWSSLSSTPRSGPTKLGYISLALATLLLWLHTIRLRGSGCRTFRGDSMPKQMRRGTRSCLACESRPDRDRETWPVKTWICSKCDLIAPSRSTSISSLESLNHLNLLIMIQISFTLPRHLRWPLGSKYLKDLH